MPVTSLCFCLLERMAVSPPLAPGHRLKSIGLIQCLTVSKTARVAYPLQ